MIGKIIYCNCAIKYRGRAQSDLDSGNYLIICKPDGTILAHNCNTFNPVNHQPSNASVTFNDNSIVSTYKKETLIISINEIYWVKELNDWSNNIPIKSKTESNLRDKIIRNIDDIIGEKIVDTLEEFKTEYGPVDLIAVSESKVLHVIEIKRKRANLSACTQLERYLKAINVKSKKGWIMSPSISPNARKYVDCHGLQWAQVEHD